MAMTRNRGCERWYVGIKVKPGLSAGGEETEQGLVEEGKLQRQGWRAISALHSREFHPMPPSLENTAAS